MTLNDKIARDLLEAGGEDDELKRQSIVDTFATYTTEEIMHDIGLNTDESFAILLPAVQKAIEKEIDWEKVDESLEESCKNAFDWFECRMEAISKH